MYPRTDLIKCFQWYFTTIAVLLGTGILGLPVTLVNAGFYPFLITFTFTFCMQCAVVVLQTNNLDVAQQKFAAIDLHTLGRRLLPHTESSIFDCMLIANFVSVLISYSLAAASAFSDVMGVSPTAALTPFVVLCSTFVTFAPKFIAMCVALFTSAKVAVLILVIAFVGVVATDVDITPHSGWSSLLEPFLVGTVAIGGVAQIMPVMFPVVEEANTTPVVTSASTAAASGGSSPPSIKRQRLIRLFRWSILAGLGTCYLLNILWADFVLGVVPQTEEDAVALGFDTSLEQAAANGEISTVPVTQIIREDFPQYLWIRWTLSVFVVISIIVSYNAVGLGFRHVLTGIAATLHQRTQTRLLAWSCNSAATPSGTWWGWIQRQALGDEKLTVTQLLVYITSFLCVWGIAFSDPQGFIFFIETFTSLAINYSCGIVTAHLAVEMVRHQASSNANNNVAERTAAEQEATPFLPVQRADGTKSALLVSSTSTTSSSLSSSSQFSWRVFVLAAFVFCTFALAIGFDARSALLRVTDAPQANFAMLVCLAVLFKLAGKSIALFALERVAPRFTDVFIAPGDNSWMGSSNVWLPFNVQHSIGYSVGCILLAVCVTAASIPIAPTCLGFAYAALVLASVRATIKTSRIANIVLLSVHVLAAVLLLAMVAATNSSATAIAFSVLHAVHVIAGVVLDWRLRAATTPQQLA